MTPLKRPSFIYFHCSIINLLNFGITLLIIQEFSLYELYCIICIIFILFNLCWISSPSLCFRTIIVPISRIWHITDWQEESIFGSTFVLIAFDSDCSRSVVTAQPELARQYQMITTREIGQTYHHRCSRKLM